MKGGSRNRIEAVEDIVIKDERRGFVVEVMDFERKEHLQGY